MSKRASMITGAIIVIVIILVAVVLYMSTKNQEESPSSGDANNSSSQEPAPGSTEEEQGQGTVTLTYTDEGFIPKSLTVSAGTVLRIINDSSTSLEFASDEHPTHTGNPELNAAEVAPGEEGSVTVTEIGTWGYHNHLNAGDTGTLEVTP